MNIILCGCSGKMGQSVVKSASQDKDCNIVAGVDINDNINNYFPIFTSPDSIDVDADVIIDFSNPSVTSKLIDYAKAKKVPTVICTTGLSKEQIEQMNEASRYVPIFYSRNMSLGVNLLIALSRQAAKILGEDYDIEIVEKHHNKKIDAPSGTALMIAEGITHERPDLSEYIYDRTTKREARGKQEIGIHSVRGGTIAGEHEVMFAGDNEILTISHHAGSREIFAKGAIQAAKYLIGKKAGLYSMEDMVSEI